MMRSIAARAWLVAAVPAFLTACGGGGGDTPQVDPPTTPPTTVPAITVSQAFTSLPAFVSPTVLKQAPGDDTRWFVGEKRGRVLVFANNPNSSSASVFLDIQALTDSSGEGGLLGIAFHPGFPATTPEVYVSYTGDGSPLVSYISRFTSLDGGQTLEPTSEEIIMTVLQPETNHNGGDIAFGPDGFLYASFGDGGGSGDPREYGQDDTNLHGTIARIDVDGAAPYEIPGGNPNAGNAVCTQGFGGAPCPEIFAWGLRNPWRMSFDRVTGRLWTGDVGQGAWEEIDVIVNGGNYGWNDREGANCFDPPSGCAMTFAEPVTEYGRSLGQSVTGGYVYRGATDSDLVGWYVFGDFISGRIFAVPEDSMPTIAPEVLLDTPNRIVTFAEDVDGELYFADFNLGTIHRVGDAP